LPGQKKLPLVGDQGQGGRNLLVTRVMLLQQISGGY